MQTLTSLTLLCVLCAPAFSQTRIHVDPVNGSDAATGTAERPFRSISAAIAVVPDPVRSSVIIELAEGTHTTTGRVDMPPDRLDLMRRMRPGVSVRIVGRETATVFGWEGGDCMVDVREGTWTLENLRIGTGTTRQRRGVQVTGPGHVTLDSVAFQTRSQSDAAIYTHRGGRAVLRGAIRINEQFHLGVPDGDTFSGIIATDHGSVAFTDRERSSLEMGNGSLSAQYYGTIELGCASARITNWSEQSNCLAVNDSGRIDLHSTPVRLSAKNKRNTPIGLEHDGHVLAEGARITIESSNDHAIVLQKASSLMCNDVELKGVFTWAVSAMSGSVCIVGFDGEAGAIEADTGAHVTVEKLRGEAKRVEVRHGASVSVPGKETARG